jgi:hypothetical protein
MSIFGIIFLASLLSYVILKFMKFAYFIHFKWEERTEIFTFIIGLACLLSFVGMAIEDKKIASQEYRENLHSLGIKEISCAKGIIVSHALTQLRQTGSLPGGCAAVMLDK